MNLINNKIFFSLIILIYSIYERSLWTNIMQWQVDQATTMWIGLKYSISNLSVGLVSSKGIPNPNGMMYLSKLLSKLPGLWSAGYALSLFQLFLIFLLGYFLSKFNKKLFYLVILVLILSISLRSTSTHLVNQWILTLVNFLFFILISIYLNKPKLENLATLYVPILIAPSIYLAGIANALSFVVCIIFIIVIFPPEITRKQVFRSFFFISLISLIFFFSVWLPYIKTISHNEIELFNENVAQFEKIKSMFKTILNFPYWSIFYSAADLSGTFIHNGLQNTVSPFWSIFHFDEQQRSILNKWYDGPLSHNSIKLLKTNSLVLTIQAIISSIILIVLATHFKFKNLIKNKNKKIMIFIITLYLFVFVTLIIGSYLGSPNWVEGERLDMQVHLFPFLLLFWFLIPWFINIPKIFNKYLRLVSGLLLFIFICTNILSGYFVITDHTNYKGNKIISDADVPLIQKQRVVEFIVNDWKKNSEKENIQIGYFFSDKRWNWVDKFGEKYEKYYPNIYTRGREYDYILLRSYGLNNSQEGIQHRNKLNNQYIINYAGAGIPLKKNKILATKQIGRLQIFKLKNYD